MRTLKFMIKIFITKFLALYPESSFKSKLVSATAQYINNKSFDPQKQKDYRKGTLFIFLDNVVMKTFN